MHDKLTPTVFHQPWWLETATDGNFHEVIVQSGGRIVGRLPFLLGRARGGWSLCGMPELTHFLGPAVDEGQGNECNKVVKRNEITRELLRRLPKTSVFYQKMHAGVSDMLIFQEQLYDVSVQFTHEIRPAAEDKLWADLRDKTRNVIRRAREKLEIHEMHDPLEFFSFHNNNIRDRGLVNSLTERTTIRLLAEALRRDQGQMTEARNAEGSTVAAVFYVWDAQTAYFLLSSRTKDAGNGAVSLLIWDAITKCSARNLVFDFNGIGTPGSILFFTGFGGRVVPRYIARSSSLAYSVCRLAFRPFRSRGQQEFY